MRIMIAKVYSHGGHHTLHFVSIRGLPLSIHPMGTTREGGMNPTILNQGPDGVQRVQRIETRSITIHHEDNTDTQPC